MFSDYFTIPTYLFMGSKLFNVLDDTLMRIKYCRLSIIIFLLKSCFTKSIVELKKTSTLGCYIIFIVLYNSLFAAVLTTLSEFETSKNVV